MSGFKHFFSPLIIDTPALQVRGIGLRERMPPGRVTRPQGTRDYLFMLFHDPVTLRLSGAATTATAAAPGSLVLWPPGALQDYGATARRWRHTWIHCRGELVSNALSGSGLPMNIPIAHPAPAQWVQHLAGIYHEIVGPRPDPVMVGNLLENALRDLSRQLAVAVRAEPPVPPALLALRRRLERTPHQPVRLAELARAIHLSVPHFAAQWRRHFQVSPIEDVIRMRIAHAKHLLLDENRRIGDVAREVGIDDPYRFSKLFRQRVGLGPRAYRAARRIVRPANQTADGHRCDDMPIVLSPERVSASGRSSSSIAAKTKPLR